MPHLACTYVSHNNITHKQKPSLPLFSKSLPTSTSQKLPKIYYQERLCLSASLGMPLVKLEEVVEDK